MENPKEFWEHHHGNNSGYWLTGSHLSDLCSFHNMEIPSGKSVLEVGVGRGIATRELAAGNTVCAVDISQAALDNLGPIAHKYLTKDMPSIPDKSVDIAICHLVFQHCEEDAAQFILDETIRALKPDGRFFLQSGISEAPVGEHIDMTAKRQLVWRDAAKIKTMIEDAGGVVASEVIRQMTSDIKWQILEITTKGK